MRRNGKLHGKMDGRKSGYVVSEESKLKARRSNPDKMAVNTPYGRFESVGEAAEKTGERADNIKYWCHMNRERAAGRVTSIPNKDYSDWTFAEPQKYVKSKRAVETPLGVFESLASAARAHGVTSAAIHHKLKEEQEGYRYVD